MSYLIRFALSFPVIGSALLPLNAQPADVVVINANVLTSDPMQPKADAFAIRDGKFMAVGKNVTALKLRGKKTILKNMNGATIVPGFIDAHCHPFPMYEELSLWGRIDLGPPRIKTMDALVAILKRKAGKTPKGLWIKGFNYHETVLGRHPTRQDLDKVSMIHPVMINHSSGHLRVCNTYALKMAKVNRNTRNPPGGEFHRDDKGELTGLLKESAASGIIVKAGPKMPIAPRADKIKAYQTCFEKFFAQGITAVHVAGTSPRTADILAAASDDDHPMHMYIMLREDYIDEALERSKMGRTHKRISFGGIKFFHGNSLSGQTCWLYKAYAHRPKYFGIPPARSQDRLNKLVLKIHKAGLQACIHSNGDREIDMVLDAYENALRIHPRKDHRHRIEHCSVVNEKILQRIKKLNLVIAPHSYVYEHGDKMEAYGEYRWNLMHANRSMLDLKIPVAGNSDFPVSAADPMLRIQSMLTRQCFNNKKVYGEKQRITLEQAMGVWTRGGAYAEFQEDIRGSITVGKQADYVVLSNDPTKVDAQDIGIIDVEQTVIAGSVVYKK